jgi:hypothetical protein
VYNGATGTAKARFSKWIKFGVASGLNKNAQEFPIGKVNTWIQLKLWFLFTGEDEIEEIQIINQTHQFSK